MGKAMAEKIFVAGHRGLVGSAIKRRLEASGYTDILTAGRDVLDLTRQGDVEAFFARERPDLVYLAAARVGGIIANDRQSGVFIRDNLLIQTNVIDAAWRNGARKLVFLGSTCIYPKFAEQPMREDQLMTGHLEPTNSAYAVAKIAGVEMCHAYAKQYGFESVCLMPTNLYGPGDNFDLESSHVIPALMRKAHEAKAAGAPSMQVWGTGSPLREFLYVDDLADAAVFAMENIAGADGGLLNVGTGEEISIRGLVEEIADVVGFKGSLDFDTSKPDGTPRKVTDVSRMTALGWTAKTGFRDGLERTYHWFLENRDRLRAA